MTIIFVFQIGEVPPPIFLASRVRGEGRLDDPHARPWQSRSSKLLFKIEIENECSPTNHIGACVCFCFSAPSPFDYETHFCFLQVGVRVLSGLLALGYTIHVILRRTSQSYVNGDLEIKTVHIEGLERSFVQVQGKVRAVVASIGARLGLEGSYIASPYIELIQRVKLTSEVREHSVSAQRDLQRRLSAGSALAMGFVAPPDADGWGDSTTEDHRASSLLSVSTADGGAMVPRRRWSLDSPACPREASLLSALASGPPAPLAVATVSLDSSELTARLWAVHADLIDLVADVRAGSCDSDEHPSPTLAAGGDDAFSSGTFFATLCIAVAVGAAAVFIGARHVVSPVPL